MSQAIQHEGFALVSVFSPCITFNHDNDFPFFKQRVKRLEDEDHDTGDWKAACEKAMIWGDEIYTGLFYKVDDRPTLGQLEPVLETGVPLSNSELGLTENQSKKIISRMM